MAHDALDTLGKVTIPRADRNVITRLCQPHGQRQRRTDRAGDKKTPMSQYPAEINQLQKRSQEAAEPH